MEIIFETHSTSLDNEVGVASGQADVDLSPRGEREAAALGARRRGEGIEVVYASDLRRSWRTAEIAFGNSSAPIVRDSRLRECDYGQLTGHPVDEIDGRREQAIGEPFPGGESYSQVVLRMIPWLEEIRLRDVRRVIVVGHRATLYALDHLLLGTPLLEAVRKPFVWRPGWVYQQGLAEDWGSLRLDGERDEERRSAGLSRPLYWGGGGLPPVAVPTSRSPRSLSHASIARRTCSDTGTPSRSLTWCNPSI